MNSTTTARAELASHISRLAAFQRESAALEQQIATFDALAADETKAAEKVGHLQARRRELLAAVAVEQAGDEDLDRIDAEIAAATADARKGQRAIEIAQAGAARLRAQHAALAARAQPEAAAANAYCYHAACELVAEALPEFKAALQALAVAQSKVFGRCAVANKYADLKADPIRLFVQSDSPPQSFSASLPNVPGVDSSRRWDFDLVAATEAAAAEALALIAG